MELCDETLKVIVAGLDNAGKTSLLTILEKIYGFEEIVQYLKPTLGINYKKRDYFGKSVLYWDFGGQAEFRDRYVHNSFYFTGTRMLYYLIDIQDEERYSLSVQYLGQILDLLKKEIPDMDVPVFICFSKSDDAVLNDPAFDYDGKIEIIRDLLNKTYPNLMIQYHSLSIYDLFSVISLHIRSLGGTFPLVRKMERVLETFLDSNRCMRGVLSDQTGLPFVNLITSATIVDTRQPYINRLLNYQLQLFRQLEEKNVDIKELHNQSDHFHTYYYRFKAKKRSGLMQPMNPVMDESMFSDIEADIPKSNGTKIADEFVNYYFIVYADNKEEKIPSDKFHALIAELIGILNS
jgi:hypothetical protein